jgi:hypothetical protein
MNPYQLIVKANPEFTKKNCTSVDYPATGSVGMLQVVNAVERAWRFLTPRTGS